MLVRYLEETAALKTDPVCVFFDLEIQSLPLLSLLQIKLFDQVGSLSPVETCNNIERLTVEGNCSMEVSLRV